MKPTLLILAAGLGSRYGGLKQVEKIGPDEETIMDYSLYDAIKSGYGKVVFVLRKEIENDFKRQFTSRYENLITIEYVIQQINMVPEGIKYNSLRSKPWGTGQAVLLAKSKIDEPFVVINADDYYGSEVFEMLKSDLMSLKERTYYLAGYKLKNTLSDYGTVSRAVGKINDQGYLESLDEKTKIERTHGSIHNQREDGSLESISGDVIVSMNLFGFTTSIFDHLEFHFDHFLKEHGNDLKAEFFLPEVVNKVIHSGKEKVKVLPTDANWFGVTYKEDKKRAKEKVNQLINEKKYPEKLWLI